jgi:hypothetical protein
MFAPQVPGLCTIAERGPYASIDNPASDVEPDRISRSAFFRGWNRDRQGNAGTGHDRFSDRCGRQPTADQGDTQDNPASAADDGELPGNGAGPERPRSAYHRGNGDQQSRALRHVFVLLLRLGLPS